MTCAFLVRHGANDLIGRAIAGRQPGVSLNVEGRAQAERLRRRFQHEAIRAIHCSPQDRARETAEPIADHLGLDIEIVPALDEIDFGEWTGLPLNELAERLDWRRWNAVRSNSRAPGGETMLEVQTRVVGHIEKLVQLGSNGSYLLVGHADPMKSALLYYLGAPIDFVRRLEISPASISAVELGGHEPRLLFINETVPT
jgi:broad specificity phosphatase PhoE